MLALAIRFYCRTISLYPESAASWHDLGVAYFRQAEDEQNMEANESAERAMQVIMYLSMKYVKTANSAHALLCSRWFLCNRLFHL